MAKAQKVKVARENAEKAKAKAGRATPWKPTAVQAMLVTRVTTPTTMQANALCLEVTSACWATSSQNLPALPRIPSALELQKTEMNVMLLP